MLVFQLILMILFTSLSKQYISIFEAVFTLLCIVVIFNTASSLISIVFFLYGRAELSLLSIMLILNSHTQSMKTIPIRFVIGGRPRMETRATDTYSVSTVNKIIAIEFVPIKTTSFASTLGSNSISAQYIFSWADKFQMQWITARRSATEMVKLFGLSSAWKWVDQPSKEKSMRRFSFPFEVGCSIAVFISAVAPNPAWGSIVLEIRMNANLGKDPLQLFSGKVIYGKIFLSHCRSILSSLVEPFRPSKAVWRLAHCNMGVGI